MARRSLEAGRHVGCFLVFLLPLLCAAPALAQVSDADLSNQPAVPIADVLSRGWRSVSFPLSTSEREIEGEAPRKFSAVIDSVIADSLRGYGDVAPRQSFLQTQGAATKRGIGRRIAGFALGAAVAASGAYLYKKGSSTPYLHYLSGPPWVECSSEPPTKPRPADFPQTDSSCNGGIYKISGTVLMVIGGAVLVGAFF